MSRLPLPHALVALLVCCAAFPTVAQEKPAALADALNYAGPPRKQDEVFLINTWALGKPKVDAPASPEVWRWSEADRWALRAIDAVANEEEGDTATLIYVHGYSFDEARSRRVGWAFYHALCDDAPAQQCVRYVIWSWPTKAKRFRPSRDFAEKAQRADVDAFYLAQFLIQLSPEKPVHLVGSSLGCRVVQGALHLLGGGELSGRFLPASAREAQPPVHAAYISACVHHDWVYDGGFHDRAIASAQRLLLINNSVDSTLLRYGKVWQDNPQALGLDGVRFVTKFGDAAKHVQQYDAHEEIGDDHGVEHYLRSPSITRRLRAYFFE